MTITAEPPLEVRITAPADIELLGPRALRALTRIVLGDPAEDRIGPCRTVGANGDGSEDRVADDRRTA